MAWRLVHRKIPTIFLRQLETCNFLFSYTSNTEQSEYFIGLLLKSCYCWIESMWIDNRLQVFAISLVSQIAFRDTCQIVLTFSLACCKLRSLLVICKLFKKRNPCINRRPGVILVVVVFQQSMLCCFSGWNLTLLNPIWHSELKVSCGFWLTFLGFYLRIYNLSVNRTNRRRVSIATDYNIRSNEN